MADEGEGDGGGGGAEAAALAILSSQGAVILRDCVPAPLLADCRAAVGRITRAIVADAATRVGGFDDAKVLTAEARRALGITRIAKIGDGKKNVHLDPYMPQQLSGAQKDEEQQHHQHPHAAMEALAEAAGVATLIRSYCGEDVTLAETGLSITRPGGCGLEWHADGRRGECTVIMSLDDIPPSMGTLGLILGSHEALDRDTSEDFDAEILEVVAREEEEHGNAGRVSYAYRRGQPIVFDARTLHAAEPSEVEGAAAAAVAVKAHEGGKQEGGGKQEDDADHSEAMMTGYRVILWWIYNGHG